MTQREPRGLPLLAAIQEITNAGRTISFEPVWEGFGPGMKLTVRGMHRDLRYTATKLISSLTLDQSTIPGEEILVMCIVRLNAEVDHSVRASDH